MYFPRFWKLAGEGKALAWGWSDTSEADAAAKAMERARRVSDRLSGGGTERTGARDEYYPDGPMREEVLREFRDGQGRPAGVVSRNTAGCLVLNTVNMMFVDIDEPHVRPPGFLERLFSGKKKDAAPSFEEKICAQAGEWLRDRPGWGWRIYRTKAGARMIATHAPVREDDPVVAGVFSAFNADPLYRNLCGKQKSFRARLTPKPRRCRMRDLPVRWPWQDGEAEAAFREWEQRYLDAAKDYATCKFAGQFGADGIHPDLRELVDYHDQATRVDTDLPLA